MADTNKQIKFGYGSLATVLGKIGTADSGLYFGHTSDGKGAVVANGELVSSKILNVETSADTSISSVTTSGYVKKTITVTYVDVTTKATKTLTFDVVDPSNVVAIAKAEAAAAVSSANTSVSAIDTFLKKTTNIKAADSSLSISTSKDGDYVTYTIDASKYNVSVGSVNGSGNILKKYTIYQGDSSLCDIDIPKDYLVKSALLKTGTLKNDVFTESSTGDKYIEFVINTSTAADEDPDSFMYLKVQDLVDVYTAGEYITISDKNVIDVSLPAVKKAVEYVTNVVAKSQGADTSFIAPGVKTGNTADTTASYDFGNASLWNEYTVTQTGENSDTASTVTIKTLSKGALAGIYQAIEENELIVAQAITDINSSIDELQAKKTTISVSSTNSSYLTSISIADDTSTTTIEKLLNSTYDTSVQGYVSDAKSAIIGTSSDASTASTIYGAKAYAKAYTDTEVSALNSSVVTALTWISLD
jgi:hypothetical protein